MPANPGELSRLDILIQFGPPTAVAAAGLWLLGGDKIKSWLRPDREAGAKVVFSFHQVHLPAICPPEGHLFTMQLWHDPDGNRMDSLFLGERFCRPGEALKWEPEQYKITTAYRCEITNYEIAPILQLRMSFNIEYRRAEKIGSGTREGELVHSLERPVIIPKIDPGPTSEFFFYVYNDGVSYARVTPSKSVAYVHPGATKTMQGELQIVGLMDVMVFPPRWDN
jgi:hypothetical protein